MVRYRVWFERALSLVTAVAVAAAVYLLVTERLVPAVRGEPVRVGEGAKLPERLEFEVLQAASRAGAAAKVRVPGRRAALLLVFSSTCPACYANLPAWRQAMDAASHRVGLLAVGLQPDRLAAADYARRHLEGALPVTPLDVRQFAGTFGIDFVPFTVLVDSNGVVRFAWQGSMDEKAVSLLTRALGAL